MKIREAIPEDISVLAGFQQKMAWETEKVILDEHVLQAGMTALFKDRGKGQYYVAEQDNSIAGCLMTTFEWSEWRNGTVLWIQSVYVADSFRGKGVYKAMYEHIRQLVHANPALQGIRLYADKANADAQAVYSKLGMNGEHYTVFEWMKG